MIIALALSMLLGGVRAPSCDHPDRGRLGVGTQKVLTFEPGFRGYVFVPGGAIDVKYIGMNQVLVIGAAPGLGELRVFLPGGAEQTVLWDVAVGSMDLIIGTLFKRLPCDSNLEVKMKDDRLEIVGEYATVEEWKAIRRLPTEFPNVTIPPVPAHFIDRAVSDANVALFRAGLDARVHRLGRVPVIWQPRPATPQEQQQIDEVLAPHVDLLISMLALP